MKSVVDECVFLRVCSVTEHGGGGVGGVSDCPSKLQPKR